MGAYEKLVPEGKKACLALEGATPWSRHSWARAARTLDRAGLLGDVGFTRLLPLTRRTGLDPETCADLVVAEAAKVRAEEDRRERAAAEAERLGAP